MKGDYYSSFQKLRDQAVKDEAVVRDRLSPTQLPVNNSRNSIKDEDEIRGKIFQ